MERRTAAPEGIALQSGRLLDLKAAEAYSGISAWTLRDLIASGDLPAVRPPRLRRVWIDRADLDRAIAEWKERGGRLIGRRARTRLTRSLLESVRSSLLPVLLRQLPPRRPARSR